MEDINNKANTAEKYFFLMLKVYKHKKIHTIFKCKKYKQSEKMELQLNDSRVHYQSITEKGDKNKNCMGIREFNQGISASNNIDTSKSKNPSASKRL